MIVDEILGTFKKRPKKAPRSKKFGGNISKYENIHKNAHFGICVMSEWGGAWWVYLAPGLLTLTLEQLDALSVLC